MIQKYTSRPYSLVLPEWPVEENVDEEIGNLSGQKEKIAEKSYFAFSAD